MAKKALLHFLSHTNELHFFYIIQNFRLVASLILRAIFSVLHNSVYNIGIFYVKFWGGRWLQLKVGYPLPRWSSRCPLQSLSGDWTWVINWTGSRLGHFLTACHSHSASLPSLPLAAAVLHMCGGSGGASQSLSLTLSAIRAISCYCWTFGQGKLTCGEWKGKEGH